MYFGVVIFALTAVIWTIQAVNFLDLVTDDGHAFLVYFFYSFLTLSKIITKLFPFAFLIASILTILKFEKDNELIILWTSGLNKIHIVNLMLRISLIMMLLQLTLTTVINPQVLKFSRSLLKDSQLQFVGSLLKEKQFNDTVEGLTIFVEKKNNLGIYENIYLKDDSENNGINTKSQVIYAKQAKLINNDQNRYFKLYKGQLIKINGKKINFINFDSINFSLSKFNTRTTTYPKIQEVNILVLLKCLTYDFKNKIKKFFHPKLGCTPSSVKNIKQEFLKRIYMPLYIPLIALITCLLILKSKENKDYQFFKLFLFFLVFFIIIVSEISLRYSTVNIYGMFFYLIFPVLLFFAIYIYLTIYFKSKI